MPGRNRMAVFIGFHELRTVKFYKAVICEFVATTLLMLFVSGTSVTMDNGKPLNTYTGAFNSAMAVAYIVWTFNHVSGAHFNPVITLCFLVTGHVSVTKEPGLTSTTKLLTGKTLFIITNSLSMTIAYTIAHCAGATAGAALVWGLVPPGWRGTLGSTTLAEEVTVAQGFAVELICTFSLVLGVFATSDPFRTDHAGSQALTIGLIVYIQSAWAGKLTGCSMNPARTLGPAVMVGTWDHHWLYWLAPAIGAMAGALLYQHILAETAQGDNISIHVEPSASTTANSTDQMKFADSIFVVEGNRTVGNLREGFDNLALEMDKKSCN